MRREREQGHWLEVERDHHDAIEEMRAVLRSGREVSNRDFAMGDRTRIDHYRGRKDSALALHYLWRVGEAMVSRRERFERVYALTEAVAPAAALREVDEDGGRRPAGPQGRRRSRPDPAQRCQVRLRLRPQGDPRRRGGVARSMAVGRLAGRGSGRGLAGDAGRARRRRGCPGRTSRRAGSRPRGRRSRRRPNEEATFLSPLDPVSARGRAKPLFGFEYTWEVYTPAAKRTFGYYMMPILWGDRLVGRFDPKLDRATGTLMILGLWLEDEALAKDAAFADALAVGMRRFMTLLGVRRIDAWRSRSPDSGDSCRSASAARSLGASGNLGGQDAIGTAHGADAALVTIAPAHPELGPRLVLRSPRGSRPRVVARPSSPTRRRSDHRPSLPWRYLRPGSAVAFSLRTRPPPNPRAGRASWAEPSVTRRRVGGF